MPTAFLLGILYFFRVLSAPQEKPLHSTKTPTAAHVYPSALAELKTVQEWTETWSKVKNKKKKQQCLTVK